MVTPTQRREAVGWAKAEKAYAERRACGLFHQPRATQRRVLCVRKSDPAVEQALLDLANQNPTWGCPQLHRQLRHAGYQINHKRTARLYQRHGLSLRRRKRRRLAVPFAQTLVHPLQPNLCWSLDFMSDTLANRRSYRTLNVIDDCARDALAIEIDFSLTGRRVVRVLDQLCEWHGVPERIRSDNGPEFRGNEVQAWAKEKGVQWQFIQPASPAQNAYVERFNGTYRREVLDAHQFLSLDEARRATQDWMKKYNEERTHSAIGHLPPMEFKRQRQQRVFPEKIGLG